MNVSLCMTAEKEKMLEYVQDLELVPPPDKSKDMKKFLNPSPVTCSDDLSPGQQGSIYNTLQPN